MKRKTKIRWETRGVWICLAKRLWLGSKRVTRKSCSPGRQAQEEAAGEQGLFRKKEKWTKSQSVKIQIKIKLIKPGKY